MTARIFHISDLHLGRRDAPEPLESLRVLAERLDPELLVVTGDVAHRGRRAQLERGRELLDTLGRPLLVVPGNHDIPYTFPARFTRTFGEWEHSFGTTEPVYTSEALVVVGLNSVRAWRQQGGALDQHVLDRVAPRLDAATDGALRVVAFHHHLAAPPWRAARKRPLSRRDHVLRSLAGAGAELVIGGHVHQAAIAERREFEVLEDAPRGSLVLVTAAGFSRPRPRRRGEALGFNVYEADAQTLTIDTYAWGGSGFAKVGRRSFARA